MDLKRLTSFVTVAELRSFTEAAARLNIVQPAISRQIQQLEEDIGVPLLWRNKRTVRTTAAGSLFMERAKELLSRYDQAREEATRAARGEVGRLSIGFLGSATSPFLPDLVQRYRQRYPGVKVAVAEMVPSEQMDAFDRGAIDVGFTRPLERMYAGQFNSMNIYKDKLVAVVANDSPMARQSSIALKKLEAESFVFFERALAPGLIDSALLSCGKAGFAPRIVAEAPLMQTILVMVAAGMGVSIVPACTRHLGVRGVRFLRFTPDAPAVGLEMVWPKDRDLPAVEGLAALLRERSQEIAGLMKPVLRGGGA